MKYCALNKKMKKQFSSGFVVISLFPFLYR